MDRNTASPTRRPRDARATWRGYLDRGMVAAAFLAIVWFMSAGLRPEAPNGFETASVGTLKPAVPVSAKAP